MTALPNDYDSDPGRFLSAGKHPHDDVHPYVAVRFAAAAARTVLDVGGGNGRLARLLPGLSMRCLLIDLSSVMLSLAPRPVVRADGARLPARARTPWPRCTRCTTTTIRSCRPREMRSRSPSGSNRTR